MGFACHGVLRRLILGGRPFDLSHSWKYEPPWERVYGYELDVRTKVSRLYLPTSNKALVRSWLHDRMQSLEASRAPPLSLLSYDKRIDRPYALGYHGRSYLAAAFPHGALLV
ncbi:hypothetical protein VNO77_27538 [Canavalia gladiata]|uniref:Uncharacterized protein n=1 Tax=Canavalia gladiata TaxID=3824 RepID=A0AAN9KXH0_CANGL